MLNFDEFLSLEIQSILKKIGFGRRNYLSYEITLGPMAHAHTNVQDK